jgi:intraflagellar transport protein 172
MAWKAAGRHSMAFVILNRFLDMADALEDPGVHGLADLENADFVNTGEPPLDTADCTMALFLLLLGP